MTLGAFVTSATAGFTASFFGRKTSLWAGCVLCVVATVVMQTTDNIGALYAARLIIGLANGLFVTHSQLWILESTPAKYRGLGLSAFQIWTSIGMASEPSACERIVLTRCACRDSGGYRHR